MTTNELHPCRKSACWIPSLLEKGYEALWPTVDWMEPKGGYYQWTFYVRWKGRRGTKVNKVRLCEKHHKQILNMFESEMASDVYEQEVTERWLIAVRNQMLKSPTPS